MQAWEAVIHSQAEFILARMPLSFALIAPAEQAAMDL